MKMPSVGTVNMLPAREVSIRLVRPEATERWCKDRGCTVWEAGPATTDGEFVFSVWEDGRGAQLSFSVPGGACTARLSAEDWAEFKRKVVE